jgi:REP element-mobilizing transposase RayT
MTENKHYHSRHSIRLPEYDYSQPGEYFITIVTRQREQLFGEILDDRMRLNSVGQIVREEWLKTPIIRHEVELGEFIIMPNHFHAIVHINDMTPIDLSMYPDNPCRGDRPVAPTKRPGPAPKSLGALVSGFKSAVTVRINEYRRTPGLPVWQRNYWEHIITSDREYETIDAYIASNPENWLSDPEYF